MKCRVIPPLILTVLLSVWEQQRLVGAANNPIILVPGGGGSRMFARLNKTSSQYSYCPLKKDWFQFWFNYDCVLPSGFKCFVENSQLHYDVTTGQLSNTEGVHIELDPVGSTDAVSYMDDFKFAVVYGEMIKHLQHKMAYNSTNLKGFPYDWRVAPFNLDGTVASLRTLIEDTVAANGHSRAIVVSHSMGGLLVQAFFERMEKSWKERFVKNWVSIANPLFGAADSVLAFVSGYDAHHSFFDSLVFRRAERSWPLNAWTLPNARYWNNSLPLVMTPQRNYTASSEDLDQLFDDIQWPLGKTIYNQTRRVLHLKPPEVNITCVYGSGLKTPARFYYEKGLPDESGRGPWILYEEGDSTINMHSGRSCLLWGDKQAEPVVAHDIPKVTHIKLLSDARVFDIIDKVALSV